MGCSIGVPRLRRRRRQRPQILEFYDLGYLTSSESECGDTPKSPVQQEDMFAENKNAVKCYFCFEKKGLLLQMPRCRCNFFAHKKCLMQYVKKFNFKCSICKEYYCSKNENESRVDLVQRIITVIDDREQFHMKKVFINSIISNR